MRTPLRNSLIVGGVLALGAVGAFAGMASAGTLPPVAAPAGLQAAQGTASTPMPAPKYPVNAKGLTYGSIASAPSESAAPDLVLVVATNGKNGYVFEAALAAAEGSGFTTPEQALAWQATTGSKSQSIPVFQSDGTTVVGEFVLSPSDGSAH